MRDAWRNGLLTRLVVVVVMVCCSLSNSTVIAQWTRTNEVAAADVPASWRDDADLHDVCFVDSEYGWAVGNHGTIWHTENSGEIWRAQASGVSCQLRAVHFVNRSIGWAAGGESIPLTSMTKGVLLATTDGGATWRQVGGLLLPWLNEILFADEKSGLAFGQASSLYPSGIWTTNDGGRTWSPLSGVKGTHWRQGDVAAGNGQFSGTLFGTNGRVAQLAQNRLFSVREPARDWASSSFALSVSPRVFFAALPVPSITLDGGKTWQSVPGLLDPTGQPRMRFHQVVRWEGQCWAVGAPGNRILHSSDLGATWQAVVAPSALPLHRLCFASAQQGWAVGARGTIVSTKDGGQSWQRQRAGNRRDAVLGVFADERDIPWDLLAQASAIDEYRTHLVLMSTSVDSSRHCIAQRVQDAAQRIGATAEVLGSEGMLNGDELSPAEILRRWPAVVERLSAPLTRLIRERRPDVVLTSEWGSPGGAVGLQRLGSQIVADACAYAESDRVYPWQLQDLGLTNWKVLRVLKCVAKSRRTEPARSTRRSASGDTAHDLATTAHQLLSSRRPSSDWTLVSMADEGSDVGYQPLASLVIEYGSAARRARTVATRSLVPTKRLAMAFGRANTWGVHQIEQLERLAGGDTRLAGDLLFELAQDATGGQRDLLLQQFVARYGNHAKMDAVLLQLVRHHSSFEEKWRAHQEAKKQDHAVQQLANAEAVVEETAEVQQVAAEQEVFEPDWQLAKRLLQEVSTKRPALYAEPEMAFALAAVKRLESPTAAKSLLEQQSRLPSYWHRRAEMELALQGEGPLRSPVVWHCQRLTQRPYLDGRLDDAVWQAAEFRRLAPSSAQMSEGTDDAPSTVIGFAKDDQYFYLAAQCLKRAGLKYASARRQRPRDAELRHQDRIEVHLDVNRDYSSWWAFSFDHRGWTRESLNGDPNWNPEYFVAADADARSWTIEVAIPLAVVASEEAWQDANWAVGVHRITPGHESESWLEASQGKKLPQLQGILHME